MSGLKLMADTNVLIRFLNGDENVSGWIIDNDIYLSFISELELYSKNGLSDKEQTVIENLPSSCTIIPYSNDLKQLIIGLRQQYRLKLPDAFVAASAIWHRLPLLTFDTDFRKVESLNILSLQ